LKIGNLRLSCDYSGITPEFDKKNGSTHTNISSLKEDDAHISKNSEIANKLNNYFVNEGIHLAAFIPPTSSHFKNYLGGDYCKSMLLLPTDEFEILKIVKKLRANTSS